jgi:hypothetical protein
MKPGPLGPGFLLQQNGGHPEQPLGLSRLVCRWLREILGTVQEVEGKSFS